MKTFLLSMCVVLSSNCFAVDDDKQLLQLSVVCQNVKAESEMVKPNLDLVKTHKKKINAALNALVKSKYLEETTYVLKKPDGIKNQDVSLIKVIRAMVDKLHLEFGYYSAQEMVDFGVYRHISTNYEDESLTLHVRLPPKYMKEFDRMIRPFIENGQKN